MKAIRTILGVVPALGFSLIPSLACPACLPALASVLGAVGLTFMAEREYLIWLNLGALMAAILLLARNERKWISWPLAVASGGATAIMLGKFIWSNSVTWWSGLGLFVAGSAWSNWNRRSKIVLCNECKPIEMEN